MSNLVIKTPLDIKLWLLCSLSHLVFICTWPGLGWAGLEVISPVTWLTDVNYRDNHTTHPGLLLRCTVMLQFWGSFGTYWHLSHYTDGQLSGVMWTHYMLHVNNCNNVMWCCLTGQHYIAAWSPYVWYTNNNMYNNMYLHITITYNRIKSWRTVFHHQIQWVGDDISGGVLKRLEIIKCHSARPITPRFSWLCF